MIRRRMRKFRLILNLGLILAVASCGKSCSQKPSKLTGKNSSANTEVVFIDQPISYCWDKPLQSKRGRVQVLIDTSGSMVGFANVLPSLTTWVQQGISQLQKSTMEIESSRICMFHQGQGIYNCTDFARQPGAFESSGNTNLHEAIRSAKDFELTFILTDGVAATGGQSEGDCARGVDAACVAKALQSFINPQSSTPDDADRGVWVIPVVARYNGKFYSEEPIVPANFQTKATIDQIRSDIGVEAVVQDPRAESNSLVFNYQGPRAMLLIVLARWAEMGRAAVQAVWERTSLNSIERLKQMKGFSSSLGILEPIELYPGFLNTVQWKSLRESDEPGDRQGTMDALFESRQSKTSISLSCPKNGLGEGVYILAGPSSMVDRVSGCVPIRILPAFNFKFRSARDGDDADLAQVLAGVEREEGSYTDLRLRLACGQGTPRLCVQNPIAAQWVAYMNYAKAADGLASGKDEHSAQQQARTLSTDHPSREPHRIFALLQTLESFYREVSQDQRSLVLANIDFCHKQ
jgi:hypothetical protein